ncbi:MAG TPA: (d)CMP kinase [Candidatus Hydrogenedentes bacterium]|nr:(d)CMP kinase [Candidatus Hydrogenedentota bacterium]HQM51255.1 (d)CMP kinase [Candidatus Hydrogenedentota bacterium]
MCSEITEIVAIDGPVGAGKSSVGRRVAEVLGFAYLDTGAMYRAATWWAMHNGVNLDDPAALTRATREMPLDMSEQDGVLRVMAGGSDITEEIRTPEITRQVYKLDHVAGVRAHLVELQRAFSARQPTVADGRDMGTVVFPKARWKVYMDASLGERVRRRAAQLAEKGVQVDVAELTRDIEERDQKNLNRPVSPLRQADDARLLDTSGLSFDEAVSAIVNIVRGVS